MMQGRMESLSTKGKSYEQQQNEIKRYFSGIELIETNV
jgi:hypothetical protein